MSCRTNGEWDQQPKLDRIALIRQRVEDLASKLRTDKVPFKSDISQISKADDSYIWPSADVSFIKQPKPIFCADLEDEICYCNECNHNSDQDFSISDDLTDGEMRIRTPPKQYVLSPTPGLHDQDLTVKPPLMVNSSKFVDVTYTLHTNKQDQRVKQFLVDLGLESFVNQFYENEICYEDLFLLTREDLAELKVPIGPRNRILNSLGKLQGNSLDISSGQIFDTLSKMQPNNLDSSYTFKTFSPNNRDAKQISTPTKPPRISSTSQSSALKVSPMIYKSIECSSEVASNLQSPSPRRNSISPSPIKILNRNRLKEEVDQFMREVSTMGKRTTRRKLVNTSTLQDPERHMSSIDTSFSACTKDTEISSLLKDVSSHQTELIKMINHSKQALTLFPDQESRSTTKGLTPLGRLIPSNRFTSPSLKIV